MNKKLISLIFLSSMGVEAVGSSSETDKIDSFIKQSLPLSAFLSELENFRNPSLSDPCDTRDEIMGFAKAYVKLKEKEANTPEKIFQEHFLRSYLYLAYGFFRRKNWDCTRNEIYNEYSHGHLGLASLHKAGFDQHIANKKVFNYWIDGLVFKKKPCYLFLTYNFSELMNSDTLNDDQDFLAYFHATRFLSPTFWNDEQPRRKEVFEKFLAKGLSPSLEIEAKAYYYSHPWLETIEPLKALQQDVEEANVYSWPFFAESHFQNPFICDTANLLIHLTDQLPSQCYYLPYIDDAKDIQEKKIAFLEKIIRDPALSMESRLTLAVSLMQFFYQTDLFLEEVAPGMRKFFIENNFLLTQVNLQDVFDKIVTMTDIVELARILPDMKVIKGCPFLKTHDLKHLAYRLYILYFEAILENSTKVSGEQFKRVEDFYHKKKQTLSRYFSPKYLSMIDQKLSLYKNVG